MTGDAAGSVGGIRSGTVSQKAEPIDSSKSVYVNGRHVVRCGDKFYMNDENTMGTLVCSPPIVAPHITDSGKLACGGGE